MPGLPSSKNVAAYLKELEGKTRAWKALQGYEKLANFKPSPPGRPMKYPYTFSAKIAQFPFKFYYEKQWMWKYYSYAFVACIPIFFLISRKANSQSNKAKWAAAQAEDAEEHYD